jgi:RNA polymerase sigma factor (sigma-70 family)
MSDKPLPTLLRYLRRLARPPGAGLSDGQLLARFVAQRDEAAFELLVWRHGPMVLNVCRRLLATAQDAEDAFQATFLVFVRKAHSIRRHEGVGGWLYRVAYRVALRARAGAAKRARHEQPGADLDAVAGGEKAGWSDLRPVLDEEISRLPERYRVPVVLCYLEGRSNQEAAEHLGCAEGTVASRLARARERLRVRLTRRGLALSVVALGAALSRETASAAVAPELVETTVRAAGWFLAGNLAAAGTAAVRPATLAEGVLKTMVLTKVQMGVAALVLAGAVAVGGGGLIYRDLAGEPAKAAGAPAAAPADANDGRQLVDVPSQVDGVLLFVGTEVKDGEKVPAGRLLKIKVGDEEKKVRRLRAGDTVEEGQLLARLEDPVARDLLAIKDQQVDSAKADWKASIKTRDEAEQRYRTMERQYNGGTARTVSLEDLRGAKLTWDRYFFEEISKKQAITEAELEARLARTRMKMHEIRSPVGGVITKFYKHRGEAVKAYEPVLQILANAERDE